MHCMPENDLFAALVALHNSQPRINDRQQTLAEASEAIVADVVSLFSGGFLEASLL